MPLFPLLLLLACLLTPASSSAWEKDGAWVAVRTPNFTIVSNAGKKQAWGVAGEFERMRSVFHAAFPNIQAGGGAPIIVLAVKSERDFRQLEPTGYLRKGALQLSGLFVRAHDQNYVLLRTDAPGENPYAVIYHEYTHFLLRESSGRIPLWLNEGLAEFYENTEIRNSDVLLGKASASNLRLLRSRPLLPLETLLRVDHNSPYYHEEDKGSIFFAESWALTHYLEIKDQREHTHHLPEYTRMVAQKMDPVAAATAAFGDLEQLQSELGSYVRQARFGVLQMPGATEIDERSFQTEEISQTQANAFRAEFLAYSGRTADAQSLAQQVLRDQPESVSACETLGYLAFGQGNLQEAGKWYSRAVSLNSQNYLAHYYFAAILLTGNHGEEQPRAESSLRTAIRLNPSFAPAYDELAVYYGMRRRNLEEARTLSLRAVELDPSSVAFRLNAARVLLQMGRASDAAAVAGAALKIANSPEDKISAQDLMTQAQQYSALQGSGK
jgi:tetratricopeptide (TPR) repeat protein